MRSPGRTLSVNRRRRTSQLGWRGLRPKVYMDRVAVKKIAKTVRHTEKTFIDDHGRRLLAGLRPDVG